MRNLILTASNYLDVNGKMYGIGGYGCNYPVRDDVFNADVTVASGSNIITTTGDFNVLLGSTNSDVLQYRWLVAEAAIVKIEYLLSATEAVISSPTTYSGTFAFVAVDYFGQPTVEQTVAVDSRSSSYTPFDLYTSYGMINYTAGGGIEADCGSDPILVHFAVDFSLLALEIQYSS